MNERGVDKERLISEFRTAADFLREPKNWVEAGFPNEPAIGAFVNMFQASFTLASAAMGECRVKAPYAPLRPVIDENRAFWWCCTHEEEHCVSARNSVA